MNRRALRKLANCWQCTLIRSDHVIFKVAISSLLIWTWHRLIKILDHDLTVKSVALQTDLIRVLQLIGPSRGPNVGLMSVPLLLWLLLIDLLNDVYATYYLPINDVSGLELAADACECRVIACVIDYVFASVCVCEAIDCITIPAAFGCVYLWDTFFGGSCLWLIESNVRRMWVRHEFAFA